MIWRFYASRGINGMGVVFLILAAIVGAVVFISPSRDPSANVNRLTASVIIGLVAFLLMMYRNMTVYDAGRSVIRTARGIAPYLKWREVPVSGHATVHLSAWRVKGTVSFGIDLTFETPAEKFPITLNGSERDLKLAIDFAQAEGATILPDTSMHTIGGRWLQKYLGPGPIK